jgi:hypothetical protein
MEHCLNCGGELRIIEVILEQPTIEKILTHLDGAVSARHKRIASGSPCGEPEKRRPNSPEAELSGPNRHDSYQPATTKVGLGHQDRPRVQS